jgi:hypothetical protein
VEILEHAFVVGVQHPFDDGQRGFLVVGTQFFLLFGTQGKMGVRFGVLSEAHLGVRD